MTKAFKFQEQNIFIAENTCTYLFIRFCANKRNRMKHSFMKKKKSGLLLGRLRAHNDME